MTEAGSEIQQEGPKALLRTQPSRAAGAKSLFNCRRARKRVGKAHSNKTARRKQQEER